jgi:hypothetical protein
MLTSPCAGQLNPTAEVGDTSAPGIADARVVVVDADRIELPASAVGRIHMTTIWR